MPIDDTKLISEYKSLTGRIRFRIFTALSMPAAWFSGLRMDVLDDNRCVTSLPGGWRSQNPFRTMYWAVQGMGAELATGAAPFAMSRSMDEKLRMFVISTEAKFVKRAKGRITFVCSDVSKAREAIEESLEKGEAVDVDLISVGKDSSGDVVSEWVFKWNLLAIERK
ncbi:MAG: thioesterase [Candidatus Marinimicrobia bacterium]|nr:thioesterase [Candidatus Neomarinimicrobiota bacterium]